MKIQSYDRYGGSEVVSGKDAVEQLIRRRVNQLGDENFTRPDYEHSEISITNSDDWSISVSLRGAITLGRFDQSVPDRFLFGLHPDDLVRLLLDLAECEMDRVLARRWGSVFDPAWRECDFYLYHRFPHTPDIFRAVGKGDAKWIDRELNAGADINHLDHHFGTPLHYAALCGWTDICRLLLKAGADPTKGDEHGETPAGYARGSDEYLRDKKAVAELVAMLEEAAKDKRKT